MVRRVITMTVIKMKAYTYIEKGRFELLDKPKPQLQDPKDAIVTVVALYDKPQVLPLPNMYGKNLTFKTGGVDGCDCAEILSLIEAGKLVTTSLITHSFPLSRIEEAYKLFENKEDCVIKVAIENGY